MAVGKNQPLLHMMRLEAVMCDDELGGFVPCYF